MGRILIATAAIALALFFRQIAQSYPTAAARLPILLSWTVILLAGAAIVERLLLWRRESAAGTGRLVPPFDARAIGIGAAFALLCAAYAAAITHAGYLVATPLFLLLSLGALRPIGWGPILVATLAVTGVIWLVFINFLGLPLPLFFGE